MPQTNNRDLQVSHLQDFRHLINSHEGRKNRYQLHNHLPALFHRRNRVRIPQVLLLPIHHPNQLHNRISKKNITRS